MSLYPDGAQVRNFPTDIGEWDAPEPSEPWYAAINIEKSLAVAHRLEALIDIEDASMDAAKRIGLAVDELERQASAALAEATASPELGATAALNDAVAYWRIAHTKLTEAGTALRCIERQRARLEVVS